MYESTRELERFLGNPYEGRGAFSFARAMAHDEAETFPEEGCALLDDWGLHRFYVPAPLGGALASFQELASLTRAVARRDLTLAIGHAKTLLGCIAAWVGGSPALQRRLADRVLAGAPVALGLTERAHGSDLLATDTVARPATGGGYALSGEKWLINNGTRSRFVTVLARTGDRGAPRDLSLLLLDKEGLPEGALEVLPKIRTHGIRGADMSGFTLREAPVPADAVIGEPGGGLDLMLKGLFVTRSLIGNLSLGAADTALRVTLDFARTRRLYRGAMLDLANVRADLAGGFASLLAAECTSLCASRAIQFLPEQLAVVSAVAKYVVPTAMEALLQRLSTVLGARHYLREGHAGGIFQKMLRDNSLTSLFDGSTAVNLSAIGLQLPELARERHRVEPAPAALFDLQAPVPRFAPERISQVSRGRDSVLVAGASLCRRLREAPPDLSPDTRELLRTCAERLLRGVATLDAEVAQLARESRRSLVESPALFDLAAHYARLHAASACLCVWDANRHADSFLGAGDWLAVALAGLLHAGRPPAPVLERVLDRLLALHEQDAAFSLTLGSD